MSADPSALVASLAGLSPLNRHFALFLAQLEGNASPELTLAAALVSRRVEEGHVCLDLATEAGRSLPAATTSTDPTTACPRLDEWVSALQGARVVGRPGDYAPLILDPAGRLYLYRYWAYERTVADFVRSHAALPLEAVNRATLAAGIARYFAEEPTDWQRAAALAALHRRFLVISGGPGTGKTSTVVKILALLLEQPGNERLRVAVAAPTGKAAARLKDSLGDARAHLPAPPEILERMPTDVSTVHRLLGAIRGSSQFRHDAGNPLPVDAVVVDEASMVDLPLMAKLVAALPDTARLLLLGDRHQLASVEAGAVLGDLCGGDRRVLFSAELSSAIAGFSGDDLPVDPVGQGLADSVVLLKRSYRFGPESGIGRVSRAVNEGAPEALDLLRAGSFSDVSWVDVGRPGVGSGGDPKALAARLIQGNAPFLEARTAEEAFAAFGRFRVLCALRRGPFGVEAVNELAERALAGAGLIHLPRGSSRWYRGRPVMVTVNDYALGLFNGDVGIALPDPLRNGELRVFFPSPHGGLRSLPPTRLPEHETVFAMTVHKSQGSEFDDVLLLLGDRPAPVLTRELLYTGLTRAKRRVEVWGSPEVFRGAAAAKLGRSSGLRDTLWGVGGSGVEFG